MRMILLLLVVSLSCRETVGQTPSTPGPSPERRFERFCSPPSLTSTEAFVLTTVRDAKCTVLLGMHVSQSGDLKRYSIIESALEDYPLGFSRYRGGRGVIATLADDENARVQALRRELPSAPKELPPMERRFVLHAKQGDAWTTLVYDRAALPAEIIELLKLVRADERMGAWRLTFSPQTISRVGTRSERGNDRRFAQLAVSPDGETFVFARRPDDVRVFEASSGERTHTLRLDGAGPCEFSPDGKFFLMRAGEHRKMIVVFDARRWTRIAEILAPDDADFDRFHFLPDSRSVLVQIGSRLVAFGTGDWKERPLPSGLPEEVRWCGLSADGRRAVVSKPDESLWLWDRERNTSIAQLDPGCCWKMGSFSPQQMDFAALTWHPSSEPDQKGQKRLRVWDATTGKLRCELFPYDVPGGPLGRHLIWTRDGDYLMATSYHPFLPLTIYHHNRIHAWNVRSGRHRGDFLGVDGSVVGLGLGPRGAELISGSDIGSVYRWDLDEALKKIRDFETSLSR